MHQIWAADFITTGLARSTGSCRHSVSPFRRLSSSRRPLTHAPPPARPVTPRASPRPRAGGHRKRFCNTGMVGGVARARRAGYWHRGIGGRGVAAGIGGSLHAPRGGNFGNKLLTEITHAEWLKKVESRPSPERARTARLRRFRLFSDSRGICLVRAADGHHRRRPRIACRRLTLITRERAFFLQV
jgi:hypothetical protein